MTSAGPRQIADRLAECLAIAAEERAAFIQAARGERAVDRLPLSTQPTDAARGAPGNLPLQLTRFIGRDKQAADVRHLLATTRWITLTGPGGSGKMRLSLQVAADVVPDFPNGAWLIGLAPVTDVRGELVQIANRIGPASPEACRAHSHRDYRGAAESGLWAR